MRTRQVAFVAYSMKPNTTVHAFFDDVKVDQYCAPGILTSNDTSTYTSVARAGNWGTQIYSSPSGTVAGQFNIPANTFKTGDRVLEITDVTNLAQGKPFNLSISIKKTFEQYGLKILVKGFPNGSYFKQNGKHTA